MMAFCSPQYMSNYQKDIYKERQINTENNLTFQSNIFDEYDRLIKATGITQTNDAPNIKVPWGRARSYAGDGPVSLPTEHRPKIEPPMVLQRTHKHFGSGLFPYPRGLPLSQYYDLTLLKKSNLRSNDELVPRPSTSQVNEKQIESPFPQEHPFSSHISRQAVFPKFDTPTINENNLTESTSLPRLVPVDQPPPPPIVVHKAMGNFARREIYTPRTRLRQPLQTPTSVEPLPIRNTWFSRHEMISSFNKHHPSIIPKIDLNIQKKKQADWLVGSLSCY